MNPIQPTDRNTNRDQMDREAPNGEDDRIARNAPPLKGMEVDLAAGGVASDGDQPNPIEQTRGGSARVA